MQQTILICDLCAAAAKAAKVRPTKPRYAVATLDVCLAHQRRYAPKPRSGRPRQRATEPGESAVERRRRLDRERHRVKTATLKAARVNAGTLTKYQQHWAEVLPRILEALSQGETQGKAVAKRLRLPPATVWEGLRRLVKAGKVERRGEGKGVRWLANGAG